MKLKKRIFCTVLTQLVVAGFLGTYSLSALAGSGTSVMQTAPVKAPGEYEIKLQNDIILNYGGGLNISPHFVTGLVEHLLDIENHFGTGKTDFQLGGLVKYNLLPDLPEQMGLSFLGGFSYIKTDVLAGSQIGEKLSFGLLSFGILASKQLEADFGQISPYIALQPEFAFRSDTSEFLLSLALGAHWKVRESAPWSYYSEFGLSLKNSVFMLALGASYPF